MTDRAITPASVHLRALLSQHLPELRKLLTKYKAYNPRLFGSVARGTATDHSDIDILVDMDEADGNLLLRSAGLLDETRALFKTDVDIFPRQLLRTPIDSTAVKDAISL